MDGVPQTITAQETTALQAVLDAGPLDAAACKLLQQYRRFNAMHCFCPEIWQSASCWHVFWAQEQGQQGEWDIVRIREAHRMGYQQNPPRKLRTPHKATPAEEEATVPLTEMRPTPGLCCLCRYSRP